MAWKAQLKSITENTTPNDTVITNITFIEDGGKSFSTSYKFTASSLTSVDAFEQKIKEEITKLDKFDEIKALLASSIGKDITSKVTP